MSNYIDLAILAVVTKNKEGVGGGAPVFYAKDDQELQMIAFNLEKILDATAHEIERGTLVLVRHG